VLGDGGEGLFAAVHVPGHGSLLHELGLSDRGAEDVVARVFLAHHGAHHRAGVDAHPQIKLASDARGLDVDLLHLAQQAVRRVDGAQRVQRVDILLRAARDGKERVADDLHAVHAVLVEHDVEGGVKVIQEGHELRGRDGGAELGEADEVRE